MTRVLVVEDEQNLREPLVYLLQKEGYDVIEAEDGRSAIDIFFSLGADLVLLDLMLPGGKRQRGLQGNPGREPGPNNHGYREGFGN